MSYLDSFKTNDEKEAELKKTIKELKSTMLFGFLDGHINKRIAADKLGDIGDSRAIPHLVYALEASSVLGGYEDVRFSAVRALEKLGRYNALEVIPHLMKRYGTASDGELRLVILKALYTIGDPKAVSTLAKALNNDRDQENRICAAKMLGKMRNSKAVLPLIEALKDTDLRVREAAAFAIGNCVDSSSIPTLEKSLLDNNDVVRRTAENCLIYAKKRYPDL